jgi:hypothetical protein
MAILTVKASELREGDIVLTHGMRVQLDSPVQSRTYPDRPDLPVFFCKGLILNVDELSDPWLVGVSRQYKPWPHSGEPTGEHRWTIQSNDLLSWRVER